VLDAPNGPNVSPPEPLLDALPPALRANLRAKSEQSHTIPLRQRSNRLRQTDTAAPADKSLAIMATSLTLKPSVGQPRPLQLHSFRRWDPRFSSTRFYAACSALDVPGRATTPLQAEHAA
jgi:hypothetical protein